MITCPNPSCQQPIPQDALFCPACGTSIQAAQDATDESLVGRVLGQKYRLVEHVAEGGMALVYKADRIFFDDFCAVKIIKKGLSSKEEMLKRFQREAKLTNKVARRSPYIIDIYDFGVEDGVGFYYVMELLNGYPFTELLQNPNKLPSPRSMVRYVCQMCEALSVVHDVDLVHRDIKPDNIFLHKGEDDADHIVKLLDFGIARPTSTKATMLTNYGRVMGTPEYMSPEQCKGPTPEQYERGESHLGPGSDIYSLGVLLYQGLTGQVPFPMQEDGGPMAIHKVMAGHVMEDPVPPMEQRPDLDISPALSAVTLKALAKEPSDRFVNMIEFRDALLSCFPVLVSEFKGYSSAESISPELATVPQMEPEQSWNDNSNVDVFAPTSAATPGVPDDGGIPLDRTAMDVQLPESILAEARRWAEQNNLAGQVDSTAVDAQQKQSLAHVGASSPAPSSPYAMPKSADDVPWSNQGPHTFDNPSADDFDMGKTVTEPMPPDVMQQLQEQAAAAIRAENAGGAGLPFPSRHTPRASDGDTTPSPPRLQRKRQGGTGFKWFLIVVLSLAILGVGGYLAYLNL
ncbi:MAG: hypothetical protein EP343_10420 [Deltaproteobacteria bacterium]|nr:MAG: hypothetical protein EP343_10420 [Deltaproteobacteria bacterium]